MRAHSFLAGCWMAMVAGCGTDAPVKREGTPGPESRVATSPARSERDAPPEKESPRNIASAALTSRENWLVEQMPGGTVSVRDGALIIDDAAGCTVWWRTAIVAPVEISYDVTVVARGGPNDRVSDVNCFWMATDPRAANALPTGRSGKFADYDSLHTYYVGMGGNNNTTTRFRRYGGDGSRPLLPEHDLRDARVLLAPNRTYHLRLVAASGIAEFWRDGEKLFSFQDAEPLTRGWFGLRTVHSHLEVRNLVIRSGAARE